MGCYGPWHLHMSQLKTFFKVFDQIFLKPLGNNVPEHCWLHLNFSLAARNIDTEAQTKIL